MTSLARLLTRTLYQIPQPIAGDSPRRQRGISFSQRHGHLGRKGRCLCGQSVSRHFDRSNRFRSCVEVAR